MSQRTDRVGDMIRATLAKIIRQDVKDPRVGDLTSISGVQVSGDLGHAQVRVSAFGDDEARAASVEALQRAGGFIRKRLAAQVRLRRVPELEFVLDRGAEHSQNISDLLENLDDLS